MHPYSKNYKFKDEDWLKLKRLAAIAGMSSMAKYLDYIVEKHIEDYYKTKYDEVFNE